MEARGAASSCVGRNPGRDRDRRGRGCCRLDWHTLGTGRHERGRQTHGSGGGAAQEHRRTVRGCEHRLSRIPKIPLGSSRYRSTNSWPPLLRPDRGWEDGALQDPRQKRLRLRGCLGEARHERVYGEAHSLQADRCTSRLHRLWRGRHSHGGNSTEALLAAAFRRGGEGPSGRLRHLVAAAGRRPPHRFERSYGVFRQHSRGHDLQHREPPGGPRC
mmetsp:Transcript_8163/g.17816  ORF Transcript_8163/g.17816 Transcript_8163/m.17816 type:complete len:216 (+) Transcript_8163:1709-2356(+)